MKPIVSKLLKSKITQAAGLLAVIAAVVASVAWSNPSAAHYKLGGSWVGQIVGVQWCHTDSPLDSSGNACATRLQWIISNADFERLSGMLGATSRSEAVGQREMISNDTAKYTVMWYAFAAGTPSPTAPMAGQIKAIFVMKGLWRYTGPDTAESKETIELYLPDGNPEHSLLPPPGATPAMSWSFDWHPHYRVAP